ncbi:hypothetical protein A8M60_17430 [Nocardia farcinica]|nr:hypothetical protein A8M60_17430 [Nocardia farcinica]
MSERRWVVEEVLTIGVLLGFALFPITGTLARRRASFAASRVVVRRGMSSVAMVCGEGDVWPSRS